MKKILAIIPARGGSKGIPKKNIVSFRGKPLIYWTIKAAKDAKLVKRVIVSSDDDEIIKISKSYGAEVLFKRPKNISDDKTKTIKVIQHCLNYLENNENYIADIVITLQPTSPLRTGKHLDQAIRIFKKKKKVDSLVSVVELPHIYNPNSLLKKNKKGFFDPIEKKSEQPTRRQNKTTYYAENGAAIYITKRKKINDYITGGNIAIYKMSQFQSIDIDNFEDLKLGELFYNNRHAL